MKRALLIGGPRFVGLHTINALITRGFQVTAVNRGKSNGSLPEGVIHIAADRNDEDGFAAALITALRNGSIDLVVDTSGYRPEQVAPAVRSLQGSIGAYIFISTASVYKESRLYPRREECDVVDDPREGEYGYNKALCERVLLEAYSTSGFPATIVRPGYIYGPNNYAYREAYFFDRLRRGRPIVMPGDGKNLDQFGHVEDLVHLILLCAEHRFARGQVFNFAGELAISLDDYTKTCLAAMKHVLATTDPSVNLGDEADIIHYDPGDFGMSPADVYKVFPFQWDKSVILDVSKARYLLGYRERYSLFEGLSDSYRWYLALTKTGRPFPTPDYSAEDRIMRSL